MSYACRMSKFVMHLVPASYNLLASHAQHSTLPAAYQTGVHTVHMMKVQKYTRHMSHCRHVVCR